MAARMVFWHGDNGQRIALLCRETTKYTHLVMLDDGQGVVLRKVPNVTYTDKGRAVDIRLRPALLGGQDYPPRKARAHYRRMAATWGITAGAQQALQEAI